MISNINRTTAPLAPPYREVLLESPRTINRRRIRPRVGADIINRTVRSHGASDRLARAWIVLAEVLEDVVFDEGVAGPAIDAEVGVAVVGGAVVGIEGDGSGDRW